MQLDKQQIIESLKAIFNPGEVFEVRVLGAQRYYRSNWKCNESGYFDYEHIEDVPEALEHIKDCKGVYFTLNPVKESCLARCRYRIEKLEKGMPTTSDENIAKRRWLPIDCDAVRESGISSTDEEHEYALAKAREIEAGMASIGFPAPIMLDSGNGAQMLYAIDLPAEDDGLVERCIREISNASDAHVVIDTTVHNPARIWRLPGTMNCKGDDTPERPHRMAKVIDIPEVIGQVEEGALHEVGDYSNYLKEKVVETVGRQSESGFDIDSWIGKFCPGLGESSPWKGGRKWVFKECPFNPQHDNGSAVLMQMASGAIAFKCHHNSCQGNDWRKLRELLDPEGCRAPIVQDNGVELCLGSSNSNISSANGHDNVSMLMEQDRKNRPWRNIDDSCVELALKGTLLGELCDIYGNVTEPKLPIGASLPKAIVTASSCMSGEATDEEINKRYGGDMGVAMLTGIDRAKLVINTGGGQGMNCYAMTIGNSASGKDIGGLINAFGSMPNEDLRDKLGSGESYLLGTAGSSEGIYDALMTNPSGMIQISELHNWLNPKHWMGNAMHDLTEMWSSYTFKFVMSKKCSGGKRESKYCAPNIIANVQPEVFKRLATQELIDTGNMGRWLFCVMPQFYGKPNNFSRPEAVRRIAEIAHLFSMKRGYVEVPQDYSGRLFDMFAGKTSASLDATWGRLATQYYPRLAVMLSILCNDERTRREDVVFSQDTWDRASVLVQWFFKNAESMLGDITDEEDPVAKQRERNYKKLFKAIEIINKRTGQPVTKTELNRYGVCFNHIRTTTKERMDALAELITRGIIKEVGSGYLPDSVPDGYK